MFRVGRGNTDWVDVNGTAGAEAALRLARGIAQWSAFDFGVSVHPLALTDGVQLRIKPHDGAAWDRPQVIRPQHVQQRVGNFGELVLDLATGTVGPDGPETTPDRRHVLFSCTKPYAGVCLHHLVERGALDYDDPVRDHWPEFAAAGTEKAEATVRHVLSHQAGLPYGPFDEAYDEWDDWDASVAAMEELEPRFRPGSTAAYHALNYGFLVGELVRRVSGQSIDEYVREHVFEPLGMTDTSIGLPAGDPDDAATLTGFAPGERCRDAGVGLDGRESEAAAACRDVSTAIPRGALLLETPGQFVEQLTPVTVAEAARRANVDQSGVPSSRQSCAVTKRIC